MDQEKMKESARQARQARDADHYGSANMSAAPFHIQALSRQMDRIELKLDNLLSELAKNKPI